MGFSPTIKLKTGFSDLNIPGLLNELNIPEIPKANNVKVSVPDKPLAKELSGKALDLENYKNYGDNYGFPLGVRLVPPGKNITLDTGYQYTLVNNDRGEVFAVTRAVVLTTYPGSKDNPVTKASNSGHNWMAGKGFSVIPVTAIKPGLTAKSSEGDIKKLIQAVVSGQEINGTVYPQPSNAWHNNLPVANRYLKSTDSPAKKNWDEYQKTTDDIKTKELNENKEAALRAKGDQNPVTRALDDGLGWLKKLIKG